MSQRNYRRQYLNQPQDTYPREYNPAVIPLTNYVSHSSYLYPNSYQYYDIVYPQNQVFQPSDYWHGEDFGYDYRTAVSTASSTAILPAFSRSQSIFSPDAPEFVSNFSPIINETRVENAVQQEHSNQLATKKKKKKKKKTITSDTPKPIADIQLQDSGVPSNSKEEDKPNSLISSMIEKKHAVPNRTEKQKSVRFKEPSPSQDKKLHLETKNSNVSAVNNTISKNVRDAWPAPSVDTSESRATQSHKQPKMSFADKLRNPPPAKSPFLDWRDQRTNAANAPDITIISSTLSNEEKIVKKQVTPTKKVAEVPPVDDGFVTVTRKKIKEKPKESEPENIKATSPLTNNSKPPEVDAKRKLEKEKKKLRDKEKKRRAREERILAEKLAPKGQKVTIITPKLMEQFLQSGRNASTSNKPVMQLNDDMFPALGKHSVLKGCVSESESEWETTETEVVKKETITPALRNVKRSDPIEFDLMALITKKSNKKKPLPTSDSSKKNKSRPGLVANVLDRSAPTLSRGKIRNKKRKLSEIRKALLAAKAKKMVSRELQATNNPSNRVKSPMLHSKKFREYCDQMLTDQIDLLARDMLYHLRMFQDRVFKKDPIKARMKKRLVAGLREVTKQVERSRVKIIFLAPDIQRCPETGGLDEAVKRLLDSARRMDLPIVYALSRRKIGRVLLKKVPVSCVGIFNYQATEETWKQLTEAVTAAREQYQLKLHQLGLAEPPEKQITVDSVEAVKDTIVAKEPAHTDVLLDLMKLSLKDGC